MTSNINGPFDVNIIKIMQFDPYEAVKLFHQLLIAEGIRTSRPVTKLSVPEAITVSDGGIDAEVEFDSGINFPCGLIIGGMTRYQIKTGKFDVKSQVTAKELLIIPQYKDKKNLDCSHLQPRVKACLDANGTFAVVLFGSDVVSTKEDKDYGIAYLRDFLKEKIDSKYANCKIVIFRANQICASIKTLVPALALHINGLSGESTALFHDMEYLEKSCGLFIDSYAITEELKSSANDLTSASNQLNKFEHIRILGDAGAGKTHFVYESLKNSVHKDCIIYCKDPDSLDNDSAFNQLLSLSKHASIIFIADECDIDTATLLQTRLKKQATNFLLISIFNESEDTSSSLGSIPTIEIKPLDNAAMKQIFLGYEISEDKAEWLSDLCHGSPRAAHKIGEFISANPNIDYANHFQRLENFWEIMVYSPTHSRDSAEGIERLVIVRTIALFRRLPWSSNTSCITETALLKILKQIDSSISLAKLQAAIRYLQRKRILQGQTTLYLSPKLLHISMWKDWWENYGNSQVVLEMRSLLQGNMLKWFDDMFIYARESGAASRVTDKLLSDQGPFATLAGFAVEGAPNHFFALAQANPKAALRTLKNALEKTSLSERKKFRAGRREIIHGLEKIAVVATNFFDAVECLLLLAEAENETWSNNATGTFVSMFSLGYGKVGASEMPPLAKIPFIRSLLKLNINIQTIVIKALEESLNPFISRADIGNTVGLRSLPDRWMPKDYQEIWDSYEAHVKLLAECSKILSQPLKDIAAIAIITHARSLLGIPTLIPIVLENLKNFSEVNSLRNKVIETIVMILHYDGKALSGNTTIALKELLSNLTELTFTLRLRRHVALQLTEDSFDENGEYINDVPKAIIDLSNELLNSPNLINSELNWLLTGDAKNGYQFGLVLGENDNKDILWPIIKTNWLQMGSNRSDFFIGGYLAGMFKKSSQTWEDVISELILHKGVRKEIVNLVWRSGMSKNISDKLLVLAENGEFEAQQFRIFVYGGKTQEWQIDNLKKVLELLLRNGSALDADAGLDIIQSRLRLDHQDINELLPYLFVLTNHSSFVSGSPKITSHNTMSEYRWTSCAMMLLEANRELALQLGLNCIKNFGAEGAITDHYYSGSLEFFDKLLEIEPEKMWAEIGSQLEDKTGMKTWKILQWLKGKSTSNNNKNCGFNLIPNNIILNWISSSPLDRALLIAQNCPPYLGPSSEPPSLARLIIENYGGTKNVRQGLHANFFTGIFSGLESEHYKSRLYDVQNLLAVEKNLFVKIFLQEEEDNLQHSIQSSLEREEERGW